MRRVTVLLWLGCLNSDKGLARDTAFKIGAAATVNPDPSSIIAPCAAINTIRIAALTDDAGATLGIDGAAVAAAIVGGTVDGLLLRRLPARLSDLEIGTAAAINPNTLAIPAPGLTKGARRAAALINELNTSAGVGRAIFAATIFGRAIKICAGSHTLRRHSINDGRVGEERQKQASRKQKHNSQAQEKFH